MSLTGKNTQFWLKPIDATSLQLDLSSFMKSLRIDFGLEPASPASSPHAAGTPEHDQWVRDNVIARQRPGTQAHAQAKAAADERLAKLRNAWGVRREQPTYAYGKTVDQLLDFIESDGGQLIADLIDLSGAASANPAPLSFGFKSPLIHRHSTSGPRGIGNIIGGMA